MEFLASSSEKAELTRVKTYLGSMKYTPEESEHSIRELSGGTEGKALFPQNDFGWQQCAAFRRAHPEFQPPFRPGDPGDPAGVQGLHHQCVSR